MRTSVSDNKRTVKVCSGVPVSGELLSGTGGVPYGDAVRDVARGWFVASALFGLVAVGLGVRRLSPVPSLPFGVLLIVLGSAPVAVGAAVAARRRGGPPGPGVATVLSGVASTRWRRRPAPWSASLSCSPGSH